MRLHRRRIILLGVAATLLGYSIYWVMFVPFYGIILLHGGWKMFYGFVGVDGVWGQIFLWSFVVLNPLTIIILLCVILVYLGRRKLGATDASL